MKPVFERWADLNVTVFEQRVVIVVVVIAAATMTIVDRRAIADLTNRLRAKEYILAPGVVQFGSVTPGIIPDAYVREFAVTLARGLGCFSAGFLMLFAPKMAGEIQKMAGVTSIFNG